MVRVEKMFEEVQSKLPGQPQFLLCLLPERKNSDLYGKVLIHTLNVIILEVKLFVLGDEVDNIICIPQVLGKGRILLSME